MFLWIPLNLYNIVYFMVTYYYLQKIMDKNKNKIWWTCLNRINIKYHIISKANIPGFFMWLNLKCDWKKFVNMLM